MVVLFVIGAWGERWTGIASKALWLPIYALT